MTRLALSAPDDDDDEDDEEGDEEYDDDEDIEMYYSSLDHMRGSWRYNWCFWSSKYQYHHHRFS
jgi:hypothetical protein